MKVVKDEKLYQSPVIEELELVNEGFVFSESTEDDENTDGSGNQDPGFWGW